MCEEESHAEEKKKEEFWEFVIYPITLRIGVFHNLLSMKNQPKFSMEDNLGCEHRFSDSLLFHDWYLMT